MQGNELQHLHPYIVLPPEYLCDLESILQYIYHGHVNIPKVDLERFIKTAEALKLKGIYTDGSKDEDVSIYLNRKILKFFKESNRT